MNAPRAFDDPPLCPDCSGPTQWHTFCRDWACDWCEKRVTHAKTPAFLLRDPDVLHWRDTIALAGMIRDAADRRPPSTSVLEKACG